MFATARVIIRGEVAKTFRRGTSAPAVRSATPRNSPLQQDAVQTIPCCFAGGHSRECSGSACWAMLGVSNRLTVCSCGRHDHGPLVAGARCVPQLHTPHARGHPRRRQRKGGCDEDVGVTAVPTARGWHGVRVWWTVAVAAMWAYKCGGASPADSPSTRPSCEQAKARSFGTALCAPRVWRVPCVLRPLDSCLRLAMGRYRNHVEAVLVTSGTGTVEVVTEDQKEGEGTVYPLAPGTFYGLDGNERHFVRASDDGDMTVTWYAAMMGSQPCCASLCALSMTVPCMLPCVLCRVSCGQRLCLCPCPCLRLRPYVCACDCVCLYLCVCVCVSVCLCLDVCMFVLWPVGVDIAVHSTHPSQAAKTTTKQACTPLLATMAFLGTTSLRPTCRRCSSRPLLWQLAHGPWATTSRLVLPPRQLTWRSVAPIALLAATCMRSLPATAPRRCPRQPIAVLRGTCPRPASVRTPLGGTAHCAVVRGTSPTEACVGCEL